MPLPKKKHSRSRVRRTRWANPLRAPGLGTCPRCNQAKLPHRICSNCGYYEGKPVLKKEGG